MSDESGLDTFTDTGNMCYAGEVTTKFATGEDIDSMKAMLANANPSQVIEVADAWKNIHEHLAGGSGSVKSDFDKAIDHVLQHWEGESADEFRRAAAKISKSIGDCATYAERTSTVMRNAGERLKEIKPKVDAIEKPSGWDKAMNALGDGFSRDESWENEIQGNQGSQEALDKHKDTLSAGKEAQLEMAAHMETLAITYSSQAQTMGSWNKRPPKVNDGEDYPGDPGGVAPVPIAATADGGGPAAAAGASRAGGTVGAKSPAPRTTGPVSATKVDGITGGTPSGAGRGGASAGGAAGGIAGGGSVPGAGAGGAAGVPGGPGLIGQASGNRGVAGGRAGIGAGAGRAGVPGGRVPGGLGAGGAGGAGGKGVGAAAGRGPLARQRGGVLDNPQAGKSPTKQGGQGLHSSRGGTLAGDRGRGSGLVGRGVAGGNVQRQRGENREVERPDYLVEDEETWMPERRDVNPPTVG